jgi:hypothetical protein
MDKSEMSDKGEQRNVLLISDNPSPAVVEKVADIIAAEFGKGAE